MQSNPTVNSFYQHKHGGIYRVVSVDQGNNEVQYLHLYPFEQKTWTRPLTEWDTDRYEEISEDTVALIVQNTDRQTLQQQIVARKMAHKG